MKIVCFLLLTLTASVNMSAQKYFKVINATSTSFAGGRAESGTGENYNITAILLTKQKVTFSDIWIGKENYGVPETISLSSSDGKPMTKGDTIVIRYTMHHYPANSPLNQAPKPGYKSPPITIQGEALIGFTVGKATRYRSIEKFKALAPKKYQ